MSATEGRWEPPAARAMRPSSGCSSSSSASNGRPVPFGSSAWQPSIGGGIHSSYTALGKPQPEQDSQLVQPSAPPLTEASQLLQLGLLPGEVTERERKLTFCPSMRARGVCGLPSCPYIHEAFRPISHARLVSVNAPRSCSVVPCRFFVILGKCAQGENCAYSHQIAQKCEKASPVTEDKDDGDVAKAPLPRRFLRSDPPSDSVDHKPPKTPRPQSARGTSCRGLKRATLPGLTFVGWRRDESTRPLSGAEPFCSGPP